MSDRQAFIEAICREPDNDAVRLVFADWLTDTADPPEPERAEFIRVQCELAALWPPEPFVWNWPTNRRSQMIGEPPTFRIGPFLYYDPLPQLWPPGTTPEDGWTDFVFDGKTYPDLLMTVEPDQQGSPSAGTQSVHSRFRPHPRGPYPHRERLNRLKKRERELLHAKVPGKPWLTYAYIWFNPTGIKTFDYDRGFISSITCAAADWLAHADAIAWHPGQTVECPNCHGSLAYAPRKCDCSPHGRIPRPCPETAQPVRKVTLTTQPVLTRDWVTTNRQGNIWQIAKWPGIEFELPRTIDVPWVGDGQNYATTDTEAYEAMLGPYE